MNSKNVTFVNAQILPALLVFFSIILGRFFIISPYESSLIWPALGFVFGFAFYYGMKVLYSLTIGSILGYVVSYLLTGDANVITLTLQGPLLGLFSVIPVYIGYSLNRFVNYRVDVELRNVAKFGLLAIIIAFLGSFSGHIIMILFGFEGIIDILMSFFVWWVGDLASLVVIGVPLLFALNRDEIPLPTRFSVEEGLFYSAFLLFAYLFFAEIIPGITFEEHKYFFSVFAIAIAFRYPYRTAYMFSLFTYTYLIFYSPFDSSVTYFSLMIDINVFLIFLTLIVLIIKDYMLRVKLNNEAILETSERLDKLINATHTLLDFSSAYHYVETPQLNQQITKMFDTIFTLFDKADYGSCMLIGKDVHFIKTVGFDTEHLNDFKFDTSAWRVNLESPQIIFNAEQKIREELGSNYDDYTKHQPPIKQSINVGFRLAGDATCEMSFDLALDNPYDYTDNDYTFFKSIQTLFQSYYESERFSQEFDSKKHEMVLSLLRTLELFEQDLKRHSLDVASVAKHLARAANLTETQVDELYWAGVVHDIGKLGVDTKVVRKEGIYSVSDYEAMKQHPVHGYRVLDQSEELKNVAIYVKHHHERYDGTGYPDQLKGDNINVGSQLLAMAEAITTMSQKRTYANAHSKREIIEVLNRERNLQFSDDCVTLAINLLNKGTLNFLFD